MSIDWMGFTPLAALIGGALIGTATAVLLLFNGRVAGISGIIGGILSGLLRPVAGEALWRTVFVAGLLSAPWVYEFFAPLPLIRIDAGWVALTVAGLLVGVGTRYALGCTSGHGVCGLSRLSVRSLVATAIFMSAGFATVFVTRHLLGWA